MRVVTGHGAGEQVEDLLDVGRVHDLDEGLHPAVEVAVHEVGAADPGLALLAPAEEEDPGVLEEAAEDGVDPDGVAQPVDARS